jgi:AraC-like DNA-binding protein
VEKVTICLSFQASRYISIGVKTEDLSKPSVPIVYGTLILNRAAERGGRREALLSGLNIPDALWATPDARLSLVQAGQLLYRGLKLDPAIGYEIGLTSNLTTHGFIGFGVMSNPTARQAIEFGAKFLQLRLPNLSLRLLTEQDQAVVEVSETIPLGAVRQCMFDLFLVGIARMAQQMRVAPLSGQANVELWFDYPEPEYYARYRDRLPRARFSMRTNQLRFPAHYLDLPLYAADSVTAQLVAQQCERELTLLGYSGDLPARVRALLVSDKRGYPDLAAVATKLHMSERTLKRKLQQHGVSFQQLLDETRKRDSMRLLEDPAFSVVQVAARVGYSDPANFTRAFRKWTGSTPSDYRARQRS